LDPIHINLNIIELLKQTSQSNNENEESNSNGSYSYSYDKTYSLPPEHIHTLEEVIGMAPIHWYPGHMHKAMTSLEEKIKQCHICLEVRDARIPLSSANPQIENLIKRHNKRRVIVFNKSDLADIRKHDRELLEDYYRQQNIPVVWAASNSTKAIRKVLDGIESLVVRKYQTLPTIVLLLGYPNVGKSSVIKAMKSISSLKSKGNPKIAPEPGVTRSISGFMVSKSPPVYVLDSPGILLPRFEKTIEVVETSLKLGITAAIKDKMVTSEVLARYILYICHVHNKHPYTWAWTRRDSEVQDKRRYFNLPSPTTDLNELLSSLARHLTGSGDLALRGNDRRSRAKDFLIAKWRNGDMGRWILDDVPQMLAERRRIEIQARRNQGKPIKRVKVENKIFDVPPNTSESHLHRRIAYEVPPKQPTT
jgi:ribosome biogenesis GTPase A